MPATVIARSTGFVDQKAEKLVPFIGNSTTTLADPFWYARLVEDGMGSIAGRAEIVIRNPMNVVDAPANAVAWNPDGPAGQIRHGMDVTIFRNFQTKDADGNLKDAAELMFTGKLDDTAETRLPGASDEVIVSASDARAELKKIRVIGRVVLVKHDDQSRTLHYQSGWPAHFNPGGRPNCIYDIHGNPWFAPYPDYRIDASIGEEPSLPSVQDTDAASYWTLGNIMLYLYNVYGPNALALASTFVSGQDLNNDYQYFPFIARCPKWINWPTTFATGLDAELGADFDAGIGQNFNSLGGARKGPDVPINGLYLCGSPGQEGVFDLLFRKAGGWSWTIQYGFDLDGSITGTKGAIINTLKAVPTRYYSSDNAVDLPFGAGGNVPSIKVITGGTIRKNSSNTITRSVGMGGIIKTETRLSTAAGGGLLNAWTMVRLNAFLDEWIANGGTELGFYQACQKYPEVLSTLILDSSYNFQGAEFSGRPRAQLPRAPWPHLLSFQGGTIGPRDGVITPFPIFVEVDRVGDGSGWTPAMEVAIAQVNDNGIIEVPFLRDIPVANDSNKLGLWRLAAGKSFPITARTDIVVNPVRMTLAIPHDERLLYAVRIASDKLNLSGAQLNSSVSFFDVNSECPDAGEFDESFSRTNFLELHTLYERWIQNNSWPVPQSSSTSATAQNNTVLRDDSTYLQSHVRRDLRQGFRLSRDGTSLIWPGTFFTSLQIGSLVKNLNPYGVQNQKPYSLKAVAARRRFTSDLARDVNGTESFANQTAVLFI